MAVHAYGKFASVQRTASLPVPVGPTEQYGCIVANVTGRLPHVSRQLPVREPITVSSLSITVLKSNSAIIPAALFFFLRGDSIKQATKLNVSKGTQI